MMWPHPALAAALVSGGAGLAVRAAAAITRPLAPDEASHAVAALAVVRGEVAPTPAPAFTLLAAAGELVAGTADWGPRLPALIASGVLLTCAYLATERIRRGWGWIAVTLLAFAPALVYAGSAAGPLAIALAAGAALLVHETSPRQSIWLRGLLVGSLVALGAPGWLVLALALAGWAAVAGRGSAKAALLTAGVAALTAVVLGSGLGLRPAWLGSLVPSELMQGSAAVDPLWYAALVPAVYAPVTATFAVLGAVRLRAAGRLAAPLAAVAAVATVVLLLLGQKDVTALALWQVAIVPLAVAGIGTTLDLASLRRAVTNPWMLLPVALGVFAYVAVSWISRVSPLPSPLLPLAALAALALPPLLLVAVVVFRRARPAAAWALALVVLAVFEVHALAPLAFDGRTPDLLVRARGSADVERAIATAEAPEHARSRLLSQADAPLLHWWAAKRLPAPNPVQAGQAPLQLSLLPDPGRPPLVKGVLVWRWSGQFASPAELFRWLAYRGAAGVEEQAYYLVTSG